jgi:hypothetical protein
MIRSGGHPAARNRVDRAGGWKSNSGGWGTFKKVVAVVRGRRGVLPHPDPLPLGEGTGTGHCSDFGSGTGKSRVGFSNRAARLSPSSGGRGPPVLHSPASRDGGWRVRGSCPARRWLRLHLVCSGVQEAFSQRAGSRGSTAARKAAATWTHASKYFNCRKPSFSGSQPMDRESRAKPVMPSTAQLARVWGPPAPNASNRTEARM